jgi:SAM-dependent methyltransferase
MSEDVNSKARLRTGLCDLSGGEKLVRRSCPSCGDPNESTAASRYSLAIWTLKTCRACRLTYLEQAPEYGALFKQIAWEKSVTRETEWRHSTRPIQQAISKSLHWRLRIFPRKKVTALLERYAEPGNLLDLGCGPGGQLDSLDSRFVPYGIEVSQELAAEAHRRYSARGGYVLNVPSLEGLSRFDHNFFTAAVLHGYLEHELHPVPVLQDLHRTLTPGGVVVVKVPNFASLNRLVLGRRWCGFRFPDHANYFTPASLKAMAIKCGFDPWFGLTWRPSTSDNMWALLIKQSPI